LQGLKGMGVSSWGNGSGSFINSNVSKGKEVQIGGLQFIVEC
jgi:hypothetical protein